MSDHLASLWGVPAMRDALARRDIGAVYRLLNARGYTQAWIARHTEQAQSEISEILSGRQVRKYRTLSRIADGLGIPRGLMGLSYTAKPQQPPVPEDDDVRRRAFLSLVSSLALGGSVTDEQRAMFTPTMDLDLEPYESVVRAGDARALTALVDSFRSTDQRHGGLGQYRAALSAVRYGESLNEQVTDEKVRAAILSGIAYVHSAAGWFAAEEHHLDNARAHYGSALDYARHDPVMRSRVLYCAGRTELHFGDPEQATKLFQLGMVGVERSPLMMAVLLSNTAWSSAEAGWHDYAGVKVEQAREAHEAVDFDRDTPLFKWFGASDLAAVTGAAHLASNKYDEALTDLNTAVAERQPWEHRSLAFETSNLARVHLVLGDTDEAVRIGQETLGHAEHVRSARLAGRLSPLYLEAVQRKGHGSDVRQLAGDLHGHLVPKSVQV